MWANSVWGLFGFAVTLGIAMMGLPPDYVWLQPYFMVAAILSFIGSVSVLCWPLRVPEQRAVVWVKFQHPLRWAIELIDPLHLIIIALVVALSAAGWQLYRGPKTVTITVPGEAPAPVVIREPPSAEDIAKAAAPQIAAAQRAAAAIQSTTAPPPSRPPSIYLSNIRVEAGSENSRNVAFLKGTKLKTGEQLRIFAQRQGTEPVKIAEIGADLVSGSFPLIPDQTAK
jgi:hypothetical protein